MKRIPVILALFFSACGGSLSDEQRKQIREGMEDQKIIKVSEAEIMAEAMGKAQAVMARLEKADSADVDDIARNEKVTVRFLTPGNTSARTIERELIDAYITGIAAEGAEENIQKIWIDADRTDYDSLLFSRPQTRLNRDSVEELEGIWNIYMSRKDLVLRIGRDK